MNARKARRIAIRILDEFEDLLDEKNVAIPSSDREGREEEARLYGSEYYPLAGLSFLRFLGLHGDSAWPSWNGRCG